MRRLLGSIWESLAMLLVLVAAYLLFSWIVSEKKVIQYELGGSSNGKAGWININIENSPDQSVPTFGMTTEEVVNFINDLNKALPKENNND
jgi:hypothetical protein